MTLTVRRGQPLTRAVAAGFAVAILVTLGIGAFGSDALRGSVSNDAPGCIFQIATGLPCAFCGMTHATLALGAGDLHGALDAHPLAPVVILGSLALLVLVAAGRSDALLVRRRLVVVLGAIALVWAINLAAW